MTRYDLIKGMPVEAFVESFCGTYAINKCDTCNGKEKCNKCLTDYFNEEVKIEFADKQEDGSPLTKEEILSVKGAKEKKQDKPTNEDYDKALQGLYELYVDFLTYGLLRELLEGELPPADEDDVEEL